MNALAFVARRIEDESIGVLLGARSSEPSVIRSCRSRCSMKCRPLAPFQADARCAGLAHRHSFGWE
ncbi:MAG TPA: hypothetical protein VHZ03_55070 [Trebonia sp.]|nr:hypothetical protein [Trebonia sp.]